MSRNSNLQHLLLTSKSKVGCEALSSPRNCRAFGVSLQSERNVDHKPMLQLVLTGLRIDDLKHFDKTIQQCTNITEMLTSYLDCLFAQRKLNNSNLESDVFMDLFEIRGRDDNGEHVAEASGERHQGAFRRSCMK